jgi:hypothetical protein
VKSWPVTLCSGMSLFPHVSADAQAKDVAETLACASG